MNVRAALRRYGRGHAEAALDTYYFLARRSFGSLLVWLMIGLSLALPAGLYLLALNLGRVEADWTARPALSVYLKVGVGAPEIAETGRAIRALSGVTSVVAVPASAALAELRRQLPVDAELASLGGNPLPHSYRVATTEGADMAALEQRLGALPNVDQVVSERVWRERFAAITRLVTQMGWSLGAMLGLTSMVVAGAAVRLAIDARLEEILVLRLFGATDAQVRRQPSRVAGTPGMTIHSVRNTRRGAQDLRSPRTCA